jgi:hypothetical protein
MRRISILLLLAIAAVSLGACRSTTSAITVEGEAVGYDDIDTEILDWWRNDGFRELLAAPNSGFEGRLDGAAPSPEFVAYIASQRVNFLATASLIKARGLEVTADDVAAQREAFEAEPTSLAILEAFPTATQQSIIDDFAAQAVYRAALNAPGAEALSFDGFSVSIDARYGTWDDSTGRVVPNSVVEVRAGRGTGEFPLDNPLLNKLGLDGLPLDSQG